MAALPTDERLVRMAGGGDDPALVALYFQLGRYLLISSSRPGDMAANLQGIWADGIWNPWNCDYHTNINVQMNYWLAETTNLAECVEPLERLIDAMREPGSRTAKTHYGARGWTVHTIHNPWGFTSPGYQASWGLFPMAGPWLCQHLWEHYAFGGDKDELRRNWPAMKESAEFCLDWLVEDPKTGKLVSGPANSPENAFLSPDGREDVLLDGPDDGSGDPLGPFHQRARRGDGARDRRRFRAAGCGGARAAAVAEGRLRRAAHGVGRGVSRDASRIIGTVRICSRCIRAGRSRCAARPSWPPPRGSRSKRAATRRPAGAWPGRFASGPGSATATMRRC